MREASARVGPWTKAAVAELGKQLGDQERPVYIGPVYVTALFVFKRPKVTEFPFPVAPTIGDLDKLLRCLNDALTKAGVFEDDRYIVEFPGPPRKVWGVTDYTVVKVGRVLSDAEKTIEVFEALGVTVDPWQRYALNSVIAANPYLDHHECELVQMRCPDAGCPIS